MPKTLKLPPKEHRRLLTPFQKDRILERDDYVCAYCNGPADQVDHVVPFSYSFDDSDSNLVACCADCNLISSSHVFGNRGEKRLYILECRAGKKWVRRFKQRLPCYCCDCGLIYRPLSCGATMFLCPDCAHAAKTMMPAERSDYLEERIARMEQQETSRIAPLGIPVEIPGESDG